MRRKSNDIIQQTISFFAERTGTQISSEDAREMVGNIAGFFELLGQWDQGTTEIGDEAPAASEADRRLNGARATSSTRTGQCRK